MTGGNNKQHKSIRKIWKLTGAQKLKNYCQMCEKQCRDAHGFKCHCTSPGHMHQMALFAQNSGHYLALHSKEFHTQFLGLIERRKAVRLDCNSLYQEHILDPEHMHLNATRWSSLTDYVSYLGREGIAKVEQGDLHLLITCLNNGTESEKVEIERQKKREIVERTEEERDRREIEDQIVRASRLLETKIETKIDNVVRELRRDDGDEPIKLTLRPQEPKSNTLLMKKKIFVGLTKKSKPIRLDKLM